MPIQYQATRTVVNRSGHEENLSYTARTRKELDQVISSWDRQYAGWKVISDDVKQIGEGVREPEPRSKLDKELREKAAQSTIRRRKEAIEAGTYSVARPEARSTEEKQAILASIKARQAGIDLNVKDIMQLGLDKARKLINLERAIQQGKIPAAHRQSVQRQILGREIIPEQQKEAQEIAERAAQQTTAGGILRAFRKLPERYQTPETLGIIARTSKQQQLAYAPLTVIGRPSKISTEEIRSYVAAGRGVELIRERATPATALTTVGLFEVKPKEERERKIYGDISVLQKEKPPKVDIKKIFFPTFKSKELTKQLKESLVYTKEGVVRGYAKTEKFLSEKVFSRLLPIGKQKSIKPELPFSEFVETLPTISKIEPYTSKLQKTLYSTTAYAGLNTSIAPCSIE